VVAEGVEYYTDRGYTLTAVPSEYLGFDMIKTPNDDRTLTAAEGYLIFEMPSGGMVYVAFDSRAASLPDWMDGFSDTGDRIYTSLSTQPYLEVYGKAYTEGECVDLGANKAPGSSSETRSNYIVLYGKGGSCDVFQSGPDWCRDCGPCSEGQGDCDSDAECEEGLICVHDVGASYGWPEARDVCEKPADTCGVFISGPDWCRDCGPCSEGQGDCDSDFECEEGSICVHDVGGNYGWPQARDVCEKPADTCGAFISSPDWCRDCGPCSEGQGDCDSDAECEEGLICVHNVGANYGWPEARDVCEKPADICGVFISGPDWCRDCGPCSEGQGDCDNDDECENGLICMHDVGANYGWPQARDVCERP
jgi:hypothetical protein